MLVIEKGMNVDEIINMFNKKSGLFGLCGERDLRGVWDVVEVGSVRYKLVIEVYVYCICIYLGVYFF